jgi:1-acyl-sn-glycerol-3-phosphate acyltransferase
MLYKLIRPYVKIGLFFLMKKIKVYGKEHIPREGAVLFIGNHQNGLIDAILLPATSDRTFYFLSRASAFKNKLVARILHALNMIPIYRIRDGVDTITMNVGIFERCHEILNQGGAIEIFAEGEHHLERRIIPLKKGFARIILGTLKKYPDLDIHIIPVGLNYDSHLNFPSSASIYYGKPILANPYFDIHAEREDFSGILDFLNKALKSLTLHIEDEDAYDQSIAYLEGQGVNYLDPVEANTMYKNMNLEAKQPHITNTPVNWLYPLHMLAKLNSLVPLLIWKYIKSRIGEIIFYNTFRFAVILTLFPLFYLIQSLIVGYLFGFYNAALYLLGCIFLGIVSTKTMRVRDFS